MNPSGWPTCRPAPDGYGNMSRMKSLGRPPTLSGWARGPAGLGASNVPSSSQRSCQRASISPARDAEYRCLGVSIPGGADSVPGMSVKPTFCLTGPTQQFARRFPLPMTLPLTTRLRRAADRAGATVTFINGAARVTVPWAQIHDEASSVAATLQARGIAPGDHVAILGPTSRALVTTIQGCWLAGAASMVLPLPMRMGSIEEFVSSTRARIRHGDAKLVLIDDELAPFYEPRPGDPPMTSIG